MTVATSSAIWGPYTGNGSTQIFAYTGKIYADTDLVVTLTATNGVETVKTITTHYTVSGVGSASGGNVTMLTAPASGELVTIRRVLTLVQNTDLRNQGAFFAETHEDVFDRLTMVDQQQQEQIDRALLAAPLTNLILSDAAVDPSVAGQIRRNGTLIKYHNGSAARQIVSTLNDSRLLTTFDEIERIRASDASMVSTTTLAADDTLVLPFLASEKWQFQFDVLFDCGDANVNAKFTLQSSVGIDSSSFWNGMWQDSSNTLQNLNTYLFDATAVRTARLNFTQMIRLHGVIQASATPGNLTLKWAPNVSSAFTVYLKKHSILRARKLP